MEVRHDQLRSQQGQGCIPPELREQSTLGEVRIVAARTNMADDTIYLDDALRDRPMDERTGGYNIVRSERVYRGATG